MVSRWQKSKALPTGLRPRSRSRVTTWDSPASSLGIPQRLIHSFDTLVDFILFKTGLRISEFCGLTIADIDFGARRIRVERQLQRPSDMRYVIQAPKTEKGIRFVPMSDEVAECFRKVIAQRPAPENEPEIDGLSGFLYLDKNGMPLVALHWEHYFQRIVAKFNSIYKEEIPKVTPHVCRHTFCSNQARAGMNPKVLQYVMGHSEIGVTLNTYTHLGFEEAREEMNRLSV